MTPDKISGANIKYGAPRGWNEDEHGPCATLDVRSDGETCQSAWRPTDEELQMLNQGGLVVLTVFGQQPVVSLHVEVEATP